MEDLNKNQIVLLTLLVSFVTSIATGIMTVSLLQEAPVEVTRNINRIVEKTIETVTTPTTIVSSPTQKEVTTVIVKEEDLVVDSINKNLKSIVRVREKNLEGVTSVYSIGLVLDKTGIIIADRKPIESTSVYTAIMHDGKELPLKPIIPEKPTTFITFQANGEIKLEGDKKENYVFEPAVFSITEPKLGQTVIAISGNSNNSVSVGRVSSLDIKESGVGTTTTKYLANIETDLSVATVGSPLLNLSGDLVGIKTSSDASKSFTPISFLRKETAVNTEKPKTE